MKNYCLKALASLTLTLVFATSILAGDIQFPASPPPPQANGDIQFPGVTSSNAPGEMQPGATGDIHAGLAEAVLSVLQSVLTPF